MRHFCLVIISIIFFSSYSLCQDKIKIHVADGSELYVNIKDIDSITFEKDKPYEFSGFYYGNDIILSSENSKRHWFGIEKLGWKYDIKYHQAMASYGNYLIILSDADLKKQTVRGSVYDIETGALIQDVPFPYMDYHKLHSNVCCFGQEIIEGGQMPLLYVSQWDYRSERGVFVYNIYRDEEGSFKADLKQVIIPNGTILDSLYIGKGGADWIVDTDKGYLYCISYYLAGPTTVIEGNKEMITKFRLPQLSDGLEVILTQDDVVDHFELEVFNKSQDKTYYNNKLYVISGCGGLEEGRRNYLRVIDLDKKKVETKIDLYGIVEGEPEGLTIYNDTLLFTLAISLTNGRPKQPFKFLFY